MNNVIADSSFYIFFFDEIYSKENLNIILGVYSFHIGPKIKKEINHYIKENEHIKRKIIDVSIDVNYSNILNQYLISLLTAFPTMEKWREKGELEVIGLSYFIKEIGSLRYLIIDDKKPYLFVKRKLNYINDNLKRTFGFLISAVNDDKLLTISMLSDIIKKTEDQITKGYKPINIDEIIWNSRIKPKLLSIMGDI